MPRLSKIGAAALAAFGWTGLSSVSASYLVVAGGGGGGSLRGGGGGAGGYLSGTASLNPTLTYTVTVGAGGTGGAGGSGAANPGASGTGSVFSVYSTAGGGGGGQNVGVGLSGGSGGGGGFQANGGTGNTPSTSPAQGTNGGAGATTAPPTRGGGGGGATSAGATGDASGNGGNGTASSISGSSVTYAGGGGGGGQYSAGGAGTGGTGGGGAGSATADGTAGTIGLGGGGGGSGYPASTVSGTGGNGGSGVVIISYAGAQQFSGGVVTSVGGNTIHTFTTSGTLGPITTLSASYLIVAGGGGGGYDVGGGGGAGGLLTGSGIVIDPNSTYLVTVGAGGAGAASSVNGTNGSSSAFSMVTTTAVGGGGGASASNTAGSSGGSGGGGTRISAAGGSGTSGQGSSGGSGSPSSGANVSAAGGGGGAGAVGANATNGVGGAGGIGVASSISGTSTYYAGGGGGRCDGSGTQGTGGSGGGGTAGSTGTAGTANTGGGGGGGSTGGGGTGGSGVVIISYPGSTQQMAGGTVTISGGNVIHTFTSTGYLAPIKLVGNSLRFRSSASAYLNRTPTTASNRTTWTWSGWVKRGTLGAAQVLFSSDLGTSNTTWLEFGFDAADTFTITAYTADSNTTSAVFRDPAAWYHVVVQFDSTQATAANRCRIYFNGVQQAVTGAGFTLNASYGINAAQAHGIGYRNWPSGVGRYFDGYLTEINFIDGQALTPSSFGTINSYGVWQPITYGGSYGTNGFYLPFKSNASSYAGFFGGSGYSIVTTATQIVPATGDFTIEAMVNFASLASYPVIAAQGTVGVAGRLNFYVSSSGQVAIGTDAAGYPISAAGVITTNQWYYIAATRSGANTVIYVNGKQVASSSSSIGTVQNTTFKIGVDWGGDYISSGYVSNVRVSNVVRTISPTTAPTTNFTNDANTILLTLQSSTVVDNSSNAYALTNNGTVTLGQTYPFAYTIFSDQSPQGNNWTPNNISGVTGTTLDYMTDVPTLTSATAANYAVLNPVVEVGPTTRSITNGNLSISSSYSSGVANYATMFVPLTGKWYWEVTVGTVDTPNNAPLLGVMAADQPGGSSYNVTTGACFYRPNGQKQTVSGAVSYGATWTTGDIIGVAVDMDGGTVTFYKNNASQGTALSGNTTQGKPAIISSASTTTASFNFGQRPFAYTPPTGYVALNTYNL